MRPSELNPDYVKFQNDQKKKKMTRRHLEQKIAGEVHWLNESKKWLERDKKRVLEHELKISEMKEQLRLL